ncbi:MAG: F0F1 ATP synthase subunit B [Ferruginibacter sp.]|nr:F0F1 ATP synthase subunit B [Ferruginibacter sp.]
MFFLELNPLVKPDLGLIIWMTLTFFVVMFVLGKYAWKPILKAVKTREDNIDNAISQAARVQAEMAQLKNDNEALLQKAREERATMLKEAKDTKDKMINEAKDVAKVEANKIIADAQAAINHQKMAALTDIKNQVGNLVVEVSEKVLRKELGNKAEQENYIKQLAGEVKLN